MSRRHRMPDDDFEDDADDIAYEPVRVPAEDSARLAALEARLAGAKVSLENKDRQIANLKRKLIDATDKVISSPAAEIMDVLRDYVRELHRASEQEANPSRKRTLNVQAEAVGQGIARIRLFLQTTRSETKTAIREETDQ